MKEKLLPRLSSIFLSTLLVMTPYVLCGADDNEIIKDDYAQGTLSSAVLQEDDDSLEMLVDYDSEIGDSHVGLTKKAKKYKENNNRRPKKEKKPKKRQEKIVAIESEEAFDEGKIILGRDYYYSLIDKAVERHWVVPISMHYSFVDKAFDVCGQTTDLANHLFGKPFTIEDVFLLSRLSNANKIKQDNDAFGKSLPLERPSGSEEGFGNFRSDQYPALIAPVEIGVNGLNQEESGAVLSGVYRFNITESDKVIGVVGATLPFKSKLHEMELSFVDGVLSREAFAQSGGTTRQTTL